MGLILDSSVVIAAERHSSTVEKLIEQVVSVAGDQDAALSSIGLAKIIHGIYRAHDPQVRARRQAFIDALMRTITVYPFTKETAQLAGRIDGEQQAKGVTIPYSDMLIGATALSLGFSIATVNLRHFQLIPGLTVIQI